LFHAKNKIEEVFGAISDSNKFLYAGVFFAQYGSDKPLFECDCSTSCSKFAIVGEENIKHRLMQIEEDILSSHENWNHLEHVEEFLEIAKHLMFIAQGDPFAPVTNSNLIHKVSDHIERSSSFENIFWSLQQLSLINAVHLCFVFLDAFYSTGKSIILKYMARYWSHQGFVVHYLINRSDNGQEEAKLPFTLMVENEFKNLKVKVKETSFKFGADNIETFLMENNIKKDDYVCFEVICDKYSKSFTDGLKEMKDNVAALWVAIGAKPVMERSGFICPNLTYPLRNPLHIANRAHKVSLDGAKNLKDGILQNEIDISSEVNIVEGKIFTLGNIFCSSLDALIAILKAIPIKKFTMLFFEDESMSKEAINEAFISSQRPPPLTLNDSGSEQWLYKPKRRKNDLLIIGIDHQCNGIETDIVSYVFPEPCQTCEFSSEDPVIASRATAMQIIAFYKRISCPETYLMLSQQQKETKL